MDRLARYLSSFSREKKFLQFMLMEQMNYYYGRKADESLTIVGADWIKTASSLIGALMIMKSV